MQEIWKDIEGYEGLYQASTLGRIKGLEKNRVQPRNKGNRTYPETILSEYVTDRGYHSISMNKYGKKTSYRVNRLIALTWLPNPNNYPVVNHKNGNKSDNSIENLEWCTQGDNNRHARVTGLNKNFGQAHHTAKLKEADVLKIRELAKVNTQTHIASLYDVSHSAN